MSLENLKKPLLWAIELGEQLHNDLKDGKLQRGEAWALIPKAWQLPDVVRCFPHIKGEWEQLKADPSVKHELIQYISKELDIDNDKAERKIMAGVNLAFAIGSFIDELID